MDKFDIGEIEDCYLLIPARTDTKSFHKLVNSYYKIEVIFIKGRLKFSNKNSAPFPSCLIHITKTISFRNITHYLAYDELIRYIIPLMS